MPNKKKENRMDWIVDIKQIKLEAKKEVFDDLDLLSKNIVDVYGTHLPFYDKKLKKLKQKHLGD